MLDRFSRTGGGAIKLAQDLREKYGVEIYAISQPTDTSNPSGIFQQNIHFLFSHYDNELRKQRAIVGLKEKFKLGIWVTKPPMGYDIVRTNGVRKIVVNDIGKKLKRAFIWKSEGVKNEEILERLRSMGVKLYKQKLTKILKNPFYCGLLAHGMLDGKVVESTHEVLISKDLFLKVNQINENNPGHGVPHKRQQDAVPFKVFIRCGECNSPFTGYVVKAKGLWYYKCRTKGCKCNKSAKEMHQLFIKLLEGYNVKEQLREPLFRKMEAKWVEVNKNNFELERNYKKQLAVVNEKIDNIEESYYVTKDMSKDTYDKFYARYKAEQDEILKQLSKVVVNISNPMEVIRKAIGLSIGLATEWASSDLERKEKLQKLIFPDGIVYDKENRVFRTERINSIFALIASQTNISAKKEKGQIGSTSDLSLSAEG